jgi:hypothetical protein|tara:strand:+ start:5635 stop:6246 length:612 start_codon:yes stop_codon:yes gene_type:complete
MTTPTEYATNKINQCTVSTHGEYPWAQVYNFLPDEYYNRAAELADTEGSAMLLDAFDSPAIVRALYEKFSNWTLRADEIKSIYSFWQRTGAGYSLKPHEDSWPRVFTIVYYFAKDDKCPQAGTSIYEVDQKNKTYNTLEVASYIPNSATIFAPNTGISWHGVDLITEQIDRQSAVVVFSAEEWNKNQLHYADWKPGRTVNYGR